MSRGHGSARGSVTTTTQSQIQVRPEGDLRSRLIKLAAWRTIYRIGVLLGVLIVLPLGGILAVLVRAIGGELHTGSDLVSALGGSWGSSAPPHNPDAELGPILGRGDAPDLFAEIERVAGWLRLVRPGQIRLHGLPVCCVTAWGRRPDRRALVIGLPLLLVLNRRQLRAVLIHELAHLARGDADRSAHLIRFVESLREDRASHRGVAFSPLRWWLILGSRVADNLVGSLAIQQEVRADGEAVRLVGRAATAQALVEAALAQILFHEVVQAPAPSVNSHAQATLYSRFVELWRRMPDPLRDRIVAGLVQADGRPTETDRPIDPLGWRLRCLGFDPAHLPPRERGLGSRRLLIDSESLERLLSNQILGILPDLGRSTFHRSGS